LLEAGHSNLLSSLCSYVLAKPVKHTSDHRGALIGLLTQAGDEVAFLRHFNAWGELESLTVDPELSSMVPWSYGHLIQIADNIFMLKIRTYLPFIG